MINFYNQVPSIYTSASRDFQYLSWLINIVLNSVKHNVDDLYDLPYVGHDPKISELLALTLGFKIKRNYDKNQLTALVSILPSILKYKGTQKAVEMAAEALITASGALGDTTCRVENGELIIILPEGHVDTALFVDLLDYIVPAGMTCRIIRQDIVDSELKTYVQQTDDLQYGIINDLDWTNTGLSSGLSVMYDLVDTELTEGGMPAQVVFMSSSYPMANIKTIEEGKIAVNAGLFDNTVIPIISGSEIKEDDTVALYVTKEGNLFLISCSKSKGNNSLKTDFSL